MARNVSARTRRVARTYETHQKRKKEKKKLNNQNALQLRKTDTNPQLSLLLRIAPQFENCYPFPYEILMKIFHDLVHISDHPIRDLCNLAQVCETWRMIIVHTPSLWHRIDFNILPLTDGNVRVLGQLIQSSPKILSHVREVALKGPARLKGTQSIETLCTLITAPDLKRLAIDSFDSQNLPRGSLLGQLTRSISQCTGLTNLSIKNTKCMFNNQKWISDHLTANGRHLEELHLTSSLGSITTQLFRALAFDYCPKLRVLDISTCDFVNTRSFDAIQLVISMPNLTILRVANVSFRRVMSVPNGFGLSNLEELSMPIAMRDADRDDALLATLAFGSRKITSLDLRGSSISAHALLELPSENVKELHVDDLCPITRTNYSSFVTKWQHSLETLSLVKINCADTVRSCLQALISDRRTSVIREVDLESSDVCPEDLVDFLDTAKSLETINLSSCRSLPRGCKGRYSYIATDNAQPMMDLFKKLGSSHSESETEIDEESAPKKRRRVKTKRPDYIEDF